jgi:two-component system, chemotaxis family, protein-glutamate methylesterase/glutaminase
VEATFRGMPDSAIRGLNVQYIVRLAEMGPLLTRLAMTDQGRTPPHLPPSPPLAPPLPLATSQACPECGGVMTEVRMGSLREFRCHTGHRIGLLTMIAQKSGLIEHALNTAFSQSQELSDLLAKALQDAGSSEKDDLRRLMEEHKEEQETLKRLIEAPRTESVLE